MMIRNELPSDSAAIENLTIAAFEHAAHTEHTEQFIVRELRKAEQLSVSLVAVDNGAVIGHVATSPVKISSGDSGWHGLGPISVDPQHQGRQVGSRLMEQALTDLRTLGAAGCVVLGDPRFYSRFGFKAEASLVLPDVPAEYFQAVLFHGPLPSGVVTYHDAFAAKV